MSDFLGGVWRQCHAFKQKPDLAGTSKSPKNRLGSKIWSSEVVRWLICCRFLQRMQISVLIRLILGAFSIEKCRKHMHVLAKRLCFFASRQTSRNIVFYRSGATFSFLAFAHFSFRYDQKIDAKSWTSEAGDINNKIIPGSPFWAPKWCQMKAGDVQRQQKWSTKLVFGTLIHSSNLAPPQKCWFSCLVRQGTTVPVPCREVWVPRNSECREVWVPILTAFKGTAPFYWKRNNSININ